MRGDGHILGCAAIRRIGVQLRALPDYRQGFTDNDVNRERPGHAGLFAAGTGDDGRNCHFIGLGRNRQIVLRGHLGVIADFGPCHVRQHVTGNGRPDTGALAAGDTAGNGNRRDVAGRFDADIPLGLHFRVVADLRFRLGQRDHGPQHAGDTRAFRRQCGTDADIGDILTRIGTDFDAGAIGVRLDDRILADRRKRLVEIGDVRGGDTNTRLLRSGDTAGKGDGLRVAVRRDFNPKLIAAGLFAGRRDTHRFAKIGLGGIAENVDRESAGDGRVTLGRGSRDGFGVVVVRAEIGGRIKGVEVEILDIVDNKVLRIRKRRRNEPDTVLGRRDGERIGEDRGRQIATVLVGIVTNRRGVLVVGKQYGERGTDTGLALAPGRQRTGARLRSHLAGFVGCDGHVADGRTGSAHRHTFVNRGACLIPVAHDRQAAGHGHFTAAGAGNRFGTHRFLEIRIQGIGRAILPRRGADFDVAGIANGNAAADIGLGLVVGRRQRHRSGDADIVGDRFASRQRAIVGIRGRSHLELAGTGRDGLARGNLGFRLVVGHRCADGGGDADLLALLLVARRIGRLIGARRLFRGVRRLRFRRRGADACGLAVAALGEIELGLLLLVHGRAGFRRFVAARILLRGLGALGPGLDLGHQ